MADCEELRAQIVAAKRQSNDARVANARAENAGAPLPHSEAGLAVLRLVVDIAPREALEAGCDVDDLAGPHVGRL